MVITEFQMAGFLFNVCIVLNIASHFIVVCHNINKCTILAKTINFLGEYQSFFYPRTIACSLKSATLPELCIPVIILTCPIVRLASFIGPKFFMSRCFITLQFLVYYNKDTAIIQHHSFQMKKFL